MPTYPYEAKTIRTTTLIRLGGDNIKVSKGRKVQVYGEDGPFGSVSIQVGGNATFGSMLKADYEAV